MDAWSDILFPVTSRSQHPDTGSYQTPPLYLGGAFFRQFGVDCLGEGSGTPRPLPRPSSLINHISELEASDRGGTSGETGRPVAESN